MRKLYANEKTEVEARRNELLAWPSEDKANPDLFYNGTQDKVMFNRSKDWFEKTMGFTKLQTSYTYVNTWDKSFIKVTFYVPKTLDVNKPVSVMWFLHGGGFVRTPCCHSAWLIDTTSVMVLAIISHGTHNLVSSMPKTEMQ
jgi:hypothetical protein